MQIYPLLNVMKSLSQHQIHTTIKYNQELDKFYLDLNTQAKSHLHLYEDGSIEKRYNQKSNVDLSEDIEDIIFDLCLEFRSALCGRDFYNGYWQKLCEEKKISII